MGEERANNWRRDGTAGRQGVLPTGHAHQVGLSVCVRGGEWERIGRVLTGAC